MAAHGTVAKGGSAARRAVDPSLYLALCELIGHDESTLLETFAALVWRGVKHDAVRGRASLYPVLFTDVMLGLKAHTMGAARRVAAVLDAVAVHGAWDDTFLSRLKSVLKLTTTTARMPVASQTSAISYGQLQASLERCWKQLQKADVSKLFAFPVTDNMAPGYSAVIRRPMDLSTMRSKIGRAHQPYNSLNAFERDVKLLVENCILFNGPKSAYARKAELIWATWLQCKATEKQHSRESQRTFRVSPGITGHTTGPAARCSGLDMPKKSLVEIDAARLSVALVLIEPFCVVSASSELCDELEMCLKLHVVPRQRSRVYGLYRVLALHLTSRRALGIDLETVQPLTKDVNVDAPQLLKCLWRFTCNQTSANSIFLYQGVWYSWPHFLTAYFQSANTQ